MRQTLPLDVLFLISSFTDSRRDLTLIMESCQDLYTSNIRLLLQHPSEPVQLYHPRGLESFCAFMLKDGTLRFRYLRKLAVHFDPTEYHIPPINALAEVFGLCQNLQDLLIFRIEALLEWDARLLDALSGLSNIHSLRIYSFGRRTRRWLGRLNSPITRLKANLLNPIPRRLEDGIKVVQNFVTTLTHLNLQHCTLRLAGVHYVHVTSLVITDAGFIKTEVLVEAFPNLQNV